jgi:hypothetical protein
MARKLEHEKIALRAYRLWELKGGGLRSEQETLANWLEAELQLARRWHPGDPVWPYEDHEDE